jgi:hypothetical protein
VDEPARAQVHPLLLLALPPERHADVPDSHRLGDPRAPALLERRTEGRLAAAGLAGDEDPLDTRPSKIDVPIRRPLDQMGGIGRCQHDGLGTQGLYRLHEPLGVPGADGYVAEADAVEGGQRRSGHERSGVVGGDDPLSGHDAGGRVTACRGGDPVVEVVK